MSLRRNTPGQRVPLLALDADGQRVAGLAGGMAVTVVRDGAAAPGQGAVGEPDAAAAPGLYEYAITQEETDADSVTVDAVSAAAGVLVLAGLGGPTVTPPLVLGPFVVLADPAPSDRTLAVAQGALSADADLYVGGMLLVVGGAHRGVARRVVGYGVNQSVASFALDRLAAPLAAGDEVVVGGLA